jgi:Tfp pilus assembly pilus retraction ATPase PilT
MDALTALLYELPDGGRGLNQIVLVPGSAARYRIGAGELTVSNVQSDNWTDELTMLGAVVSDAQPKEDVQIAGRRFFVVTRKGVVGVEYILNPVRQTPWAPESAGLPSAVVDMVMNKRGIVLIAGSRGSGRSTTLAALIHHLNRSKQTLVYSLSEIPTFEHAAQTGIVWSKSIAAHDARGEQIDFGHELRADVFAVDLQMLSPSAVQAILQAPDRGVTCLVTVTAPSAVAAIQKFVAYAGSEFKQQALAIMARSLIGVVCQSLVPHPQSNRFVLATELCVNSERVKLALQTGVTDHIQHLLQSDPESGWTMGSSVQRLVAQGFARSDLI